MRRFLLARLLIPSLIITSVSFDSVTAQETEGFCDPIGRLISGLEIKDGEELLCAGGSLPAPEEDTTIKAVCFGSQEVAELEASEGEIISASDLCRPSHSVVQCGDGICFGPRGEVAAIEISVQESSSITLLDWNDVPGSDRYLIEVFEGSESIFLAHKGESHVETDLPLNGDETVAVTAISSTSFIIGYGSFSTSQEDEGRPVSWMIE